MIAGSSRRTALAVVASEIDGRQGDAANDAPGVAMVPTGAWGSAIAAFGAAALGRERQ
jgi:hypothetical protein